jgi:hypothetical protein
MELAQCHLTKLTLKSINRQCPKNVYKNGFESAEIFEFKSSSIGGPYRRNESPLGGRGAWRTEDYSLQ